MRQIATSCLGTFYEVQIVRNAVDLRDPPEAVLLRDGAVIPMLAGNLSTPAACRDRAGEMDLAEARENRAACGQSVAYWPALVWRTYP
jgi:hypothetical protein